MADDKNGRERKAADAERRQRAREIATALERGDEPEPPVEARELVEIDAELEAVTFPATGADVVAAAGGRTVDSAAGSHAVEELIPDTVHETFDSPSDVHARLRRPTVAAALKRVADASGDLPREERFGTQREAYLKTFSELRAIDSDDDDEVIGALSDWIVEHIREKDALPGSRAVRRQAAKICRANGYRIRDDDWLGV